MGRPRVTQADAVLDAAALRLATDGIAGTTIEDVAAAAGVSRATVYRYVGGKDEIVQAVIGRETEVLVARLESVIGGAESPDGLIADLVTTALDVVSESPVLARLSGPDLGETLPFITTRSAPLVAGVVTTLSAMIRSTANVEVADDAIEPAVEEATRFVLTALTTPRPAGSAWSHRKTGDRAARLISPMLQV